MLRFTRQEWETEAGREDRRGEVRVFRDDQADGTILMIRAGES